MGDIHTQPPALQTFKSKSVLQSRAIECLATMVILESLKTLGIVVHIKYNSHHSKVLLEFPRSLPPLDNLALTCKIRPTRCKKWIPSYAPNLERLQLMMVEHRDSSLDLVSLSAMMQPPLLLLEHLRITIQRSKSNSDEAGMYKSLGAMPRLQSIVIELDSSISSRHIEFRALERKTMSEYDPNVTIPRIMDTLVNSAVDQELAIAISNTISAAKHDRSLPLERLELRPSGRSISGYNFTLVGIGKMS